MGEDIFTQNEHYELSWAGKAQARREIQKTTSATLTPDSVILSAAFSHEGVARGGKNPAENNAKNPSPAGANKVKVSEAGERAAVDESQNAQHVFIEGENLEVLRVLQKSYFGRVKMIYIDPPYNTGNDSFVYPDDYTERLSDYKKRTGLSDENGFINKQDLWRKNSKESGQYHSVWLSMMYPRLYLARNLLRDDGVIFISIDDNEAANLKLLCDEVFGAENFVAQLVWKSRQNKDNRTITGVSNDHEYVFCYSKNSEYRSLKGSERKADSYSNPDNDARGKWASGNMVGLLSESLRPNCHYDLINPDTNINYRKPKLGWRYDNNTMQKLIQERRIIWPLVITGRPRRKVFLSELSNDLAGFSSIVGDSIYTRHGTAEIELLFDNRFFDFPKPPALIKSLVLQSSNQDDIILDFFAGSGTTAQAVMELNLEDGGNRQAICVQMPETLDETSEAYKAGYRTIAEITRARITKVIAKLKAEKPMLTQDLACANFTLTPSHFKVWQPDVAGEAAIMQQLELHQQAEHPASLQQNMLTELLLKMGLGLAGVEAKTSLIAVAKTEIYAVSSPESGLLWLCFNPYKTALKAEIVKAKPQQIIFLNSCFVGSNADEQLTNLQLELQQHDIKLTVI